MTTNPHNYSIPSKKVLEKMNGKNLLRLKNKMNAIISKIKTDTEWTASEQQYELSMAKLKHKVILSYLDKFGNIEK